MNVQGPPCPVDDGAIVTHVITIVKVIGPDGLPGIFLAGGAGGSPEESMTLDNTLVIGILEHTKLAYFDMRMSGHLGEGD